MSTPRDRPVRMADRPLALVGRLAVLAVHAIGLVIASIDPFTLLFYASYATVGVVLAIRRPRNSIGWLLIAIGFAFIGTTAMPDLDSSAVSAGAGSTRDRFVAWVGSIAASVAYTGFLALALLFPTGQLPGGRSRRLSIALLGTASACIVLTAISPTMTWSAWDMTVTGPNPAAVLPSLPLWDVVSRDALIVVNLAVMGAGFVLLVARYRRATGALRLQMRWLVAAIVAVAGALFGALAIVGLLGDTVTTAIWLPLILAYPLIPIAIGVAVLRYRLYEIDRIISRTISWAIVTGALLVVFGAIVVGLQSVLSDVTQGDTFAVAVSTLVAFALFAPLRRRVQRVVDRRFHRAAYDTERITAAFAARLRDQVDLEVLRAELTATIGATMRPISAGLWLRPSGEASRLVTDPGRRPR